MKRNKLKRQIRRLEARLSELERREWERAHPPVNVKDFGAAGDGVSDDTNPIQAAIEAIRLQGGGRVDFPPGTYLVGGPIS